MLTIPLRSKSAFAGPHFSGSKNDPVGLSRSVGIRVLILLQNAFRQRRKRQRKHLQSLHLLQLHNENHLCQACEKFWDSREIRRSRQKFSIIHRAFWRAWFDLDNMDKTRTRFSKLGFQWNPRITSKAGDPEQKHTENSTFNRCFESKFK